MCVRARGRLGSNRMLPITALTHKHTHTHAHTHAHTYTHARTHTHRVLHVRVHKIDEFSDTAGFMDRTGATACACISSILPSLPAFLVVPAVINTNNSLSQSVRHRAA